jgi:hypothetical protein
MLCYYIILAWIIHRAGFEHSEALFHAEKIKLLFEVNENTLLTLGTTFPSIIYISSIFFTPFGYLYAPVLASIVFTTLLFYVVLIDFEKSPIPRRVFVPMIFLLFFFHPGILYAAISGRGVAAILLFFYLVFRSLFKYYQTQTTYYLSLASIFLSLLVFCDFNFIWLLFGFFPFIFLVSLDGLKIKREQPPVIQYLETLNNVSQRRKLVNRTVAIYIIIFLLPFIALYLFRTLNFYHAGDATYFLTSQYANWSVTGNPTVGNLLRAGIIKDPVVWQSQIIYQVYVLALTPLLILLFIFFKGKIYELFTLFAPFILMAVLLLDVQRYFTIEYYLLFLILALAGLSYYAGKKYKSKIIYPIMMAVTVLNIFTGIFYFKKTKDIEEIAFFEALKTNKKWSGERTTNEEYVVAAFISDITDDTHKILMDDAAAYKVMAHLRTLKSVILPANSNFLTIADNPKSTVKYICIAKKVNPMQIFTVLNEFNLNKMKDKGTFDSKLMFESDNWAVYKIM